MSLERLLKDRVVEKTFPNKNLALKILKLAKRDLKTAKYTLKNEDYDWSLAIAYNAMLQAGRSLMFSKGYRPYSQYKHVAVIQFVHEVFGKEITDRMVDVFNRMRKKRHRVVYEEPGIVSEDEAENAIRFAEEFVNKVSEIVEH